MTDNTSDTASPETARLISEADFDGLVCAVLLRRLGLISEICFVHPQDVTENLISLTPVDVLVGFPFRDDVGLVFNHELVAGLMSGDHERHVTDSTASSNASVIFQYYRERFDDAEAIFPMVRAADQAGSRTYTMDEVLNPSGWTLLTFLLDPRSGLGRHGGLRISNKRLILDLVDHLTESSDVDEVLTLPDVRERLDIYKSHKSRFEEQIHRCSTIVGNVLFIDWSEEPTVAAGNRFVKYALYPQVNTSLQFSWGFERQTAVFTAGKSIFNRTCSLNVGALMLQYGGGGSADSGSCQGTPERAGEIRRELIERLLTEPVPVTDLKRIL